MGVEVLSVIRVEEEVAAAYSGDNIKLKLKGVEEEVRDHALLSFYHVSYMYFYVCSLLDPFVPPSLPPFLPLT